LKGKKEVATQNNMGMMMKDGLRKKLKIYKYKRSFL